MPVPLAALVVSATVAPAEQVPTSRDSWYGVQHQQVPLNATDFALRGQRL